MKRYDKIWVPEKRQGFLFRDKYGDTPSIVIGPVIVLTEEELLDLIQESIEYSNTTLLRQKAIDLLHSKLKV